MDFGGLFVRYSWVALCCCPGSSVVERVLGKDEVAGSTPVSGSMVKIVDTTKAF